MLAHPSKRKHGLPGEDAYFVHDEGAVVVIGVADGTSVAGARLFPTSCVWACCSLTLHAYLTLTTQTVAATRTD